MTDSPTGRPGTSREKDPARGSASALPKSLDDEVLKYRANSFAASTSKTYLTQLSAYLNFCSRMNIKPVPLSQENLGHNIAFLSRRLCFSSVKQYLNVVRLVHLEAGLQNPLEKNWYVSSILKGVNQLKGDASLQKLLIALDILKQVFLVLDLHSSFDRAFLGSMSSWLLFLFRKSNVLIPSHLLFDPGRNLCANDVQFTDEGVIQTVRWSKVIQLK